jgi:hypothetical protein
VEHGRGADSDVGPAELAVGSRDARCQANLLREPLAAPEQHAAGDWESSRGRKTSCEGAGEEPIHPHCHAPESGGFTSPGQGPRLGFKAVQDRASTVRRRSRDQPDRADIG